MRISIEQKNMMKTEEDIRFRHFSKFISPLLKLTTFQGLASKTDWTVILAVHSEFIHMRRRKVLSSTIYLEHQQK